MFYTRVVAGPAHVWVKIDTSAHPPDPGLLLMWRRGRHGRWEGFVVWATYVEAHDQLTVRQEWIAAAHLQQMEAK